MSVTHCVEMPNAHCDNPTQNHTANKEWAPQWGASCEVQLNGHAICYHRGTKS